MKQGLSMVVQEEEVLGLSPTSSNNPTPQVDDLKLKKEGDKGDEDNGEEDMFEIFYRKKKYYRDNENKVYEIKEDDEVGPCIGNWVKQDNGKFKVVKS